MSDDGNTSSDNNDEDYKPNYSIEESDGNLMRILVCHNIAYSSIQVAIFCQAIVLLSSHLVVDS